jgi:hypothetical protein
VGDLANKLGSALAYLLKRHFQTKKFLCLNGFLNFIPMPPPGGIAG